MIRTRPLLLALALTASSVMACQQEPTTSSRRSLLEQRWSHPPCDRTELGDSSLPPSTQIRSEHAPCSIAIHRTGIRLNTQDADPVVPIVELANGGFAAITSGRDQIATWDSAGELTRVFGRSGAGPGEFMRLGTIFRGPYDTLFVQDAASQMEVFDPTGRHSRTIQGPVPAHWESATVLDDGNFLVASSNPVPDQHLFGIISGETGDAVAVFGGTRLRRRPGGGDHQLATERRLIAYHGGSTFWSVSPIRYELELWTVGGERVAQVHRRVSWFRDRLAEEAQPTGTEELLVGLHLDADDVLWVTAYIPSAAERDVPPSPDLGVQPRTSTIRVEAFDARTARLLASEHFEDPYDFWVAPFADSRAYRVRFDADGIMSVEVVRYRLVQRVD